MKKRLFYFNKMTTGLARYWICLLKGRFACKKCQKTLGKFENRRIHSWNFETNNQKFSDANHYKQMHVQSRCSKFAKRHEI